MTSDEIEYVRFRLARTEETFEEAKIMLEKGHLYAVVNRLYYACFYAVSALLYSEGYSSSKHSGVRALFSRHWVNTGRISAEMGHFYRQLFERRQKGDYGDFVEFNRAEVEQWMEKSEKFLALVSEKAQEKLAE